VRVHGRRGCRANALTAVNFSRATRNEFGGLALSARVRRVVATTRGHEEGS
jgi:hypothetical protein